MCTAQKSERAGFSLVELLTALAVAALILPAIVAVLPRAFDALVTASTTASAARATAAFDAAFPPKEKAWAPSQEEFYIYSHSSVVR